MSAEQKNCRGAILLHMTSNLAPYLKYGAICLCPIWQVCLHITKLQCILSCHGLRYFAAISILLQYMHFLFCIQCVLSVYLVQIKWIFSAPSLQTLYSVYMHGIFSANTLYIQCKYIAYSVQKQFISSAKTVYISSANTEYIQCKYSVNQCKSIVYSL